MKNIFTTSAVALAVGVAMVAPAAADTSITGSVRIGGLFDDGSGEDDISISSLGSRFIMASDEDIGCLLYTSPSPRDATLSRMPSSA